MVVQQVQTVSTSLTLAKPCNYNLLNLDNPETINTIKNSICKGASNDQLSAFMTLAKHFNLNPFNKEIYFSSQIGVFVGRHGKLRIANRHPDYRGLLSCEIREKDDFEFDAANNKITKHITGKNKGNIIGAWATGKRKGFDDVTIICWLDEYKKGTPSWGNYTQDMIKYKAEDRVLRTLFNSEYEGIPTVDPEQEYISNARLTLADTHSPAPRDITDIPMEDWFNDDSVITVESEELFINKQQQKRFWTIASNYKLSKAEVKEMLIKNKLIEKDPETDEYSTSMMFKSLYEFACDKLETLARNGVEGQTHLIDIEQ